MTPKVAKPTKASKADKKANKPGKNANKGKMVVKNLLENPFSLTLPCPEEELLASIKKQLMLSCSGLSLPDFKAPCEELFKLSGKERAKYREQFKENALKKLLACPEAAQQYKSAKEAHSHMIFGYNAVMKALEQNRLAGILLKANVEPKCLGQMFLPGCISKGIPLVLVQDMDQLLKRKDMLGLNHSAMVLGLKTSVREPTCKFFLLWESMMKVVHTLGNTCDILPTILMPDNVDSMEVTASKDAKILDSGKENLIGSLKDERSEKNSAVLKGLKKDKEHNLFLKVKEEKQVNVLYKRMSPEELNAYHLKRVSVTHRVFIPQGKQIKNESMEDVIYMSPSKVQNFNDGQSSDSSEMANSKPGQKVDAVENPSSRDFQLGFYLDTDPDDDKVKKATTKSVTTSNPKKKKTERALLSFHLTEDDAYIPAKAKRIKNNPHKKKKS